MQVTMKSNSIGSTQITIEIEPSDVIAFGRILHERIEEAIAKEVTEFAADVSIGVVQALSKTKAELRTKERRTSFDVMQYGGAAPDADIV